MHDWHTDTDDLGDRLGDVVATIGDGLKRLLSRRDLSDAELVSQYRQTFSRRMEKERARLAGHTTSFLGGNAIITGLWAITGAGFPWFLFPLFGWGIGYVSHRAAVQAREQEYAEVMSVEAPTRRQLRLHRDLWKVRRSWRGHLASNGMTIALLVMINTITWGGFPWAAIPGAFITLGIVSHRTRARLREQSLLDELSDAGWTGSIGGGTSGPDGAEQDLIQRAKALRTEILAIAKTVPDLENTLGSDFSDVLDRYVSQIGALVKTQREVSQLAASIPVQQMETQRAEIQEKIASVSNERLRREYQTTLEQIERQLTSAEELQSEREILRVRIDNGLQALHQLKIDVTRARTDRFTEAEHTLADVRSRSAELSRYLDDLRTAWDEIS
ncbi:MAG: 2TM domain-containing protein [Spirochaeta sp.]|jgi:hypothetical protein|nr:2TM domain-containing protein [Spirochaeta sp.]